MRRGLKLDGRDPGARKDYRSTMFPDEEGTETLSSPTTRRRSSASSTMFPDEEGTETWLRFCWRSLRRSSSTMFPDEEGTETSTLIVQRKKCCIKFDDVPR